jgi:hypothetical protein
MCDSDAVQDMINGEEAQASELSDLAGIACSNGGVMTTGGSHPGSLTATCWDPMTKHAHGPAIGRCPDGQPYVQLTYSQGKYTGLNLRHSCDTSPNTERFRSAACFSEGELIWCCEESPESGCIGYWSDLATDDTTNAKELICSTTDEVDALVLEYGCP